MANWYRQVAARNSAALATIRKKSEAVLGIWSGACLHPARPPCEGFGANQSRNSRTCRNRMPAPSPLRERP